MGLGALTAAFLGALLWDAHQARQEWSDPVGGRSFVREGSSFVSAHPSMVRQSFSVEKAPDEFRVFVLGSSQAMGTPYVHQDFNRMSGRLLGLPNEGGISTWLAAYLQRLLPASRVKVINAAMGGQDLASTVETLKDALALGQPDLLVILEGNNERALPEIGGGYLLPPEADLREAVGRLTASFELELTRLAALIQEAGVPAYLLTVPNNLRDFEPAGREAAEEWRQAKALDASGEFAAARERYLRAKDLDRAFLRTRTPWNQAIRRAHGRSLRVLDMERIVGAAAGDGIPGEDLFHDYCHLRLAANRLVAFEIAKRFKEDRGLATPLTLEDSPLGPFTDKQLARLYRIKAFKWSRAGWFADLDEATERNVQTLAAQYRRDAESAAGRR